MDMNWLLLISLKFLVTTALFYFDPQRREILFNVLKFRELQLGLVLRSK